MSRINGRKLDNYTDWIAGSFLIILMSLPGGSVPGIGVQLANKRGGKRIVRLDPMTGFPRTERVVAE